MSTPKAPAVKPAEQQTEETQKPGVIRVDLDEEIWIDHIVKDDGDIEMTDPDEAAARRRRTGPSPLDVKKGDDDKMDVDTTVGAASSGISTPRSSLAQDTPVPETPRSGKGGESGAVSAATSCPPPVGRDPKPQAKEKEHQLRTCKDCGAKDHWRRMEATEILPEMTPEAAERCWSWDETKDVAAGKHRRGYEHRCIKCVAKRDGVTEPEAARGLVDNKSKKNKERMRVFKDAIQNPQKVFSMVLGGEAQWDKTNQESAFETAQKARCAERDGTGGPNGEGLPERRKAEGPTDAVSAGSGSSSTPGSSDAVSAGSGSGEKPGSARRRPGCARS